MNQYDQSSMLPIVLASALLAVLAVYALFGGGDFGAGMHDWLARGKSKARQRALIDRALAPVWEANHVWLIVAVVLLFAAFPSAFFAIMTGLNVPLTVMMFGIVLRGAAFGLRLYDSDFNRKERVWAPLFGFSSAVATFSIGLCAAALLNGKLTFLADEPALGYFRPWLGFFPVLSGLAVVALCVLVSGAFFAFEADDNEVAEIFRRRSFVAGLFGLVLFIGALGAASPELTGRLAEKPLFVCIAFLIVLSGFCSVLCLYFRKLNYARWAAAIQVVLAVFAWGVAMYPYVVYPGFSVVASASSPQTLKGLLLVLGAGSVALVPSLYWLLRLFRSKARDSVLS